MPALFIRAKSGKRNEDGDIPQMARCGYIGLVSNENREAGDLRHQFAMVHP
jgi:hypothetical protein